MGGIRGGQKKAIFADFRWVLNNSPSRDILKSLFGTFWGVIFRVILGGIL